MPLNIELKSATNETLNFIIDRNNILFVFTRERSSIIARLESYARRDDFDSTIDNYISEILPFCIDDDINKPSHLSTAHISEWDKSFAHIHFILREMVSMKHLEIFFKNIPQHLLNPFISEESKVFLFATARNYFADLQSKPATRSIEAMYVNEKYTKQIAEERSKDPSRPEEFKAQAPGSLRMGEFNNFRLRTFDFISKTTALQPDVTPSLRANILPSNK